MSFLRSTIMKIIEIGLILLATFTTGITFVHDNLDYLYPAYTLIDNAMKNDHKLMFKMKQVFFPTMNYRFWQVDGAEVIPIDVCVMFHQSTGPPEQTKLNSTKTRDYSVRECWSFLWTNSLLLNLIPGDMLMAMDPCFMVILYSDIVGSYSSRGLTVQLSLHLNGSLSLEEHSLNDYEQAFALYLCLVSVTHTP